MQPVQYRGYAQGTAFNPIILSDQSRKILEQNEQFLRGLQAKQKIERDFEVAKLKQLQQNIESQRQQLNENFGYEQRQRDRYNQSLQANAAREIQDLKRIAALEPEKPTTAKVVNDIADFLVSTSKTAAEVIGEVKKAKTASDIAAAQEISSLGITDAYIGGKAKEAIIIDTATNAVIGKYASYSAFKESGYQLQAGQEIRVINEGVQAQLALSQSKQQIKSFTQRFGAQAEFIHNGESISRQQFQLLDATEKQQVFQDALAKELDPVRQVLSPAMLRQVDNLSGKITSEFVGKAYKQQTDVLDGLVLEAARQQLIADPTPDNIHNYGNIVALHNGGDRAKANAEYTRILSDPTVVTDAQFEHFSNTTYPDQLGNNSTFRKRNAVTYNEIKKNRLKSQLAAEQQDDIQREIEENRDINALDEYLDKDKEDGRIDHTKHQEFSQLALEAEADGKYKLARHYRSQIQLTASFQKLEETRKRFDALHAQGALFPHMVRESGLEGKEYSEYLAKANQNLLLVQPLKEDLSEAVKIHESSLQFRLTAGHAYKGEMPPSYYKGLRILKNTYQTSYINNYRKTGDRTTAHEAGMGASNFLIGKDKHEGLFRVPKGYDEIAKQLASGGRIGDFEDDRLRYAPALDPTNTITDFRQRVEDLGMDAIPTVITKERIVDHFDTYKQTGRIPIDASIDAIRKELDIPYVEAFNYAVEKLGDESLKLPKELYEGAMEVESVARDTPLRKFLNSRAKLDPNVTTPLVLTAVSGQPFQQSAAAKSSTSDFDGLFNALATQESSGDPSRVNTDSGATGLLQVMPENIGPWSQEILGRAMTKEEFLADPEAQRRVGRGKLRQYYNEYILRGESPDEAIRKTAASWYAGPNWESAFGPNFHNDKKPQVFGDTEYPSMYDYTTKVLQRVRGN